MSKRRRGLLGKWAGVKPACYAGPVIGGCHGPLSEEHPLSEGLRRGRRVEVAVSTPDAAGVWQKVFSPPPVAMAHASAKILCTAHNNALSPVDQEAIHLQTALREIKERSDSPLIIPSARIVINGYRFGQFLCKRVVGSFVIHDPRTPPAPDLVRYAFGRPTLAPLYFYSTHRVGERPGFGRTDNVPITRIGTPTDVAIAYLIEFEGISTLITSLAPGDRLFEDLRELEGALDAGWIDRLQGIETPMKGRQVYRIVFDWRDDPRESRLTFVT